MPDTKKMEIEKLNLHKKYLHFVICAMVDTIHILLFKYHFP